MNVILYFLAFKYSLDLFFTIFLLTKVQSSSLIKKKKNLKPSFSTLKMQ